MTAATDDIAAGVPWFGWFVTTLSQERLDTGIAIAGFVCLVPLAAYVGDLIDLLLIGGGALLVPGWLVWTVRLLRTATASQARTRA
jgi:hypothetical protein